MKLLLAQDPGDIVLEASVPRPAVFEKPLQEVLDWKSLVGKRYRIIAGGATNFTLTLDTTGPAGVTVSIASGAETTSSRDVSLAIATSDGSTTGYQMKIWGSGIDTTDNANIQDTEANSSWISYSATQVVKLSTGDGSKSVTVRLRDDVWNESSTATDTITLDTSKPVPNITSGPDVTRISKISGKRTCSFGWQADQVFDAYKIKVVPGAGSVHTAGTQIPTTNGSTNMAGSAGDYPATTTINSTIDGRDLETADAGDGAKIIKIFVQEDSTNPDSWSI